MGTATKKPSTAGASRMQLGRPGPASIAIELANTTGPTDWELRPGIEFWSARMTLNYGWDSVSPPTIAWAQFWRVDLLRVGELSYELDNISHDLGVIGGAIAESEGKLGEHWVAEHMDATILIASDGVVDKIWRGNRLGPALLFHAADSLRVDAVFLAPAALRTKLTADGVCTSEYGGPRPGPDVQAKVLATWRKAGFQKLKDGVVWLPTGHGYDQYPDHGEISRDLIEKAQVLAEQERFKAWWRRRVRRQLP